MPRARSPQPNANRTDLLAPPAPIARIPDEPYGEQAQQVAAQRQIPGAGGPGLPANVGPQGPGAGMPLSPPQTGQGGPGPLGHDQIAALLQQHANRVPEGGILNRPTDRPNEPVTQGLSVGPGRGPEILKGVGAAVHQNTLEQATVAQLLNNLANRPGASSAMKVLAAQAGLNRL